MCNKMCVRVFVCGIRWGRRKIVLTPGMSFHTFLSRTKGVSWVNFTEIGWGWGGVAGGQGVDTLTKELSVCIEVCWESNACAYVLWFEDRR